MEEYDTCGFFRREGGEYVPVIPTTTTFTPYPPAGVERGYMELPDVGRMRKFASDDVAWRNLETLQELWSELRGDRRVVGRALEESDISQHIAALGRLASTRRGYLKQLLAEGGGICVNYAYKSPIGGRRYAAQAFASQNLPRGIREEAFSSTASEVNMVNAFPRLLGQLVAKVCGTEYAGKKVSGSVCKKK